MLTRLAVLLVPATLVACCCGLPLPTTTNTSPTPTSKQPVKVPKGRVKVSRAEFGERWPLTVESGELECMPGSVLVFHTGGKTYAVNGTAQARGYPRIDPIWRANPELPGAKVSIQPLLDAGLKLCK